MTGVTPTAWLVDDDAEVRTALCRLLMAEGIPAVAFATPEACLTAMDGTQRGCMVLDLAMPGLNGLEVQDQLAGRGCDLPIIFLTGHADVSSTVRAMKHGAVDFLTKPVDAGELVAAVRSAFARDAHLATERAGRAQAERLCASLTRREREVLVLLLGGWLNKQVAGEIGTAEQTVKYHRANIMRKLGAGSFAEVVRLAQLAGVAPAPTRGQPWPKV